MIKTNQTCQNKAHCVLSTSSPTTAAVIRKEGFSSPAQLLKSAWWTCLFGVPFAEILFEYLCLKYCLPEAIACFVCMLRARGASPCCAARHSTRRGLRKIPLLVFPQHLHGLRRSTAVAQPAMMFPGIRLRKTSDSPVKFRFCAATKPLRLFCLLAAHRKAVTAFRAAAA